VEALKEYCNLWVTINEPNALVFSGYLIGVFPPGKKDVGSAIRALTNLVRAHAAAYRAIHQVQPQARAGVSHYYRSSLPAHPWFPPDRLASRTMGAAFNESFPRALQDGVLRLPMFRRRIPEARGTQDFFGLDYYTRDYVAFNIFRPREFFMRRFFRQGCDVSHTGFIACEPDGMFEALNWARNFNLPVIILENGVEDPNDVLRPQYLALHLMQVWRAVNFNWPVKGYFHWTLVDNFEWERGWTQRFGLWELDVETQARRKRPSADLYAQICRENAISAEAIERYTPALVPVLFP
jgi:beta-glucosidase